MTPTSPDSDKEAALPDALREPLDSLSIELTCMAAKIESFNSGLRGIIQQAVAQVRETIEKEYRARMEISIRDIREKLRKQIEEELRKLFDTQLRAQAKHVNDVATEITRVLGEIEGVGKEIAAMLGDPSIELAQVMRKRAEQAELEAYLNGLSFSAGGQSKAKANNA